MKYVFMILLLGACTPAPPPVRGSSLQCRTFHENSLGLDVCNGVTR